MRYMAHLLLAGKLLNAWQQHCAVSSYVASMCRQLISFKQTGHKQKIKFALSTRKEPRLAKMTDLNSTTGIDLVVW